MSLGCVSYLALITGLDVLSYIHVLLHETYFNIKGNTPSQGRCSQRDATSLEQSDKVENTSVDGLSVQDLLVLDDEVH
jgi:hypothetical protein